MAAKGSTTANDVLLYILNQTALPVYGSSSGTVLWLALHTADPGAGGTATTNEATYGSYARVSIARTSGGFTVSGTSASNTAIVLFPTSSGTTNTITHMSLTVASSGSTQILYRAALGSSLLVTTGLTPEIPIGGLVISES